MFPLQRDCDQFYGNPRGRNGKPSIMWEAQNLVHISPPFKMYYDGNLITSIRIHKRCSQSLERVLNRIWIAARESQDTVDKWGASTFAGTYVYRVKRGGGTLSMHAYGCAIDLDPNRNAFRDETPNFGEEGPNAVVAAFEAEGWTWGGRWKGRSCDGMHFQAARVSNSPSSVDIARAQRRLRDLAYAPGAIDGRVGNLTVASLAAFQHASGLPVNGELDEDTMQRLESTDAPVRPVESQRAALTAEDLLEEGSRTISGARKAQGNIVATALAAGSTGMTAISQAQDVASQVQSGVAAIHDGRTFITWATDHWQSIALLALLCATIYFAWRAYGGAALAIQSRVDDARTAKNSER